MAGDKLPTEPTKGAGTTLWIFTDSENPDVSDVIAKAREESAWTRLAKIRELTPGALTAEAEDDSYLDDLDADWKQTAQGEKSAGETNLTLAWKPGEEGQQQLIVWYDAGTVLYYKVLYPNGAFDIFRGWISSLGKTVVAKEIMTRTLTVNNTGRPPVLAEDELASGGEGGNSSGPATITITTQPQGDALDAGDKLELSVTASVSDGSALQYQWKKDENNIAGASAASYSKSAVTEEDAGGYTCVISSSKAASVTTDSAEIVVA
jgi:uncharacterized protein YjdB